MEDRDYDIWLEAYQQACAIAAEKEFTSKEEYEAYVLDLSGELYDSIINRK